jgi:hypothetical protein
LAHELPQQASDWLLERIGKFRVIQCCRAGGQRTGVWQLRARPGRYYFKINHHPLEGATELFVYRNWAHVFRPFVAQLCGVCEAGDLCGLLMSSLDGITLRDAKLSWRQATPVFEQAGDLCRRLHELPPGEWYGHMDADGLPARGPGQNALDGERDPMAYYGGLIENGLRTAADSGGLTAPYRAAAERVLRSLPGVDFPEPVPTSRDFAPNNWLVNGRGMLVGIIDFESMGWGLRTDSFVRLAADYFPRLRRCEDAFFGGYGSRPPQEQPQQLHIGCVLRGLRYATVAGETGDTRAAECAGRAFAVCPR